MKSNFVDSFICQSCSMPMRVESDFGTNKDGSKNVEYCAYCFKDGQFIDSDMTKDKMIERIAAVFEKEKHMNSSESKIKAIDFVSTLKRWK